MSIKNQLFLIWTLLMLEDLVLCFRDGWRTEDLVSLGIVMLIGAILAAVIYSNRIPKRTIKH